MRSSGAREIQNGSWNTCAAIQVGSEHEHCATQIDWLDGKGVWGRIRKTSRYIGPALPGHSAGDREIRADWTLYICDTIVSVSHVSGHFSFSSGPIILFSCCCLGRLIHWSTDILWWITQHEQVEPEEISNNVLKELNPWALPDGKIDNQQLRLYSRQG